MPPAKQLTQGDAESLLETLMRELVAASSTCVETAVLLTPEYGPAAAASEEWFADPATRGERIANVIEKAVSDDWALSVCETLGLVTGDLLAAISRLRVTLDTMRVGENR